MAGIYLLQGNGPLVEMGQQPYDREDVLQRLLAEYPSLLAGDQIDPTMPRRWLLISREMAVPAEDEGGARWSLDHLFLDQDAIPTLVEVKRSSDNRIRREVVGQMLDYAANAVVYWPVEKIRAQFEARCEAEGDAHEQVLAEFLGVVADSDQFWLKVKTNLQAGRVRLVFVADEIPPELQRVVEFLNGQMDPAEVLAVEIRQYVGQGVKTLIPRVLGQTAAAQQKKAGGPSEGRQWDEGSFFQELGSRQGPEEPLVARKILEWARAKRLRVSWGKGRVYGSFTLLLDHGERAYSLTTVYTLGTLAVPFQGMAAKPPFDDEERRRELLRRLNEIPGVELSPDAVAKFPSIRLSTLKEEAARHHFLAALDWTVDEITGS
jgi:hypothetical protein